MKPRITKQAGRWHVARPAFGFSRPNTTTYASWQAALSSIDASAAIVPLTTELSQQPHNDLSSLPAWTPMCGRAP